jgi:carbon-monoxide dehydrogenase medium subunit
MKVKTIMYEFDYLCPSSLAKAILILEAEDEAKLLAGGMTLIPTLKQRLAQPSILVDLAGIIELQGIREQNGVIVLGAMACHAEVASSPLVKSRIPALASLAEGIGDAHVRNRGTVGGSVSNADPAADYPAAVLGLNATIITSKREIAGDDFFTGLFETMLKPGEITVALHFPIPEAAAYVKFPNPASRYATVGVFVARIGGAVRVSVTGAGPSVFRVPEMEAALSRSFHPEAIKDATVSADGLNSDGHATSDYRAHLIGVMARRAVAACI